MATMRDRTHYPTTIRIPPSRHPLNTEEATISRKEKYGILPPVKSPLRTFVPIMTSCSNKEAHRASRRPTPTDYPPNLKPRGNSHGDGHSNKTSNAYKESTEKISTPVSHEEDWFPTTYFGTRRSQTRQRVSAAFPTPLMPPPLQVQKSPQVRQRPILPPIETDMRRKEPSGKGGKYTGLYNSNTYSPDSPTPPSYEDKISPTSQSIFPSCTSQFPLSSANPHSSPMAQIRPPTGTKAHNPSTAQPPPPPVGQNSHSNSPHHRPPAPKRKTIKTANGNLPPTIEEEPPQDATRGLRQGKVVAFASEKQVFVEERPCVLVHRAGGAECEGGGKMQVKVKKVPIEQPPPPRYRGEGGRGDGRRKLRKRERGKEENRGWDGKGFLRGLFGGE